MHKLRIHATSPSRASIGRIGYQTTPPQLLPDDGDGIGVDLDNNESGVDR